jgi:hypothetical protein
MSQPPSQRLGLLFSVPYDYLYSLSYQKSEIRGQRSEVRDQKSEVRGQPEP